MNFKIDDMVICKYYDNKDTGEIRICILYVKEINVIHKYIRGVVLFDSIREDIGIIDNLWYNESNANNMFLYKEFLNEI